MSYFKHHVFFCTNQRAGDEACCANHQAAALHQYAKQRIAELGLNGRGQIRMNKSGCLDRCELGPVMVVYPEGVWYTFIDEEDVDDIIQHHLIQGKIVERLHLDPDAEQRPVNQTVV